MPVIGTAVMTLDSFTSPAEAFLAKR
jgi:hypothetical protein